MVTKVNIVRIVLTLRSYPYIGQYSAFVERLFFCSWTVSEEKSLESVLPAASGFHRDATLVKMILNK